VVTAYERKPAAVGVGFYRVSVGSCSLGRFYDSPMFVGHRLNDDIRAVFQKTIARLPVVCLDRVRLNVCDPSWIDASRYPVLIDQLLPPHSIKPRDPMRVLVFHRDFVEEPETRRSGEPLLSLHIDEHAHGAALFSCAHGGGEFMRLLDVLKNADDALAFLYRAAPRVELELDRVDAVLILLEGFVDLVFFF